MDQDSTPRECPVCGKTYLASRIRLRWGRQTTCSRACSYALRANKLEKKVRLRCGVCGAEFERPPSHIKGKHGGQFCSPACHYAGRSAGLSKRVVIKPYNIPPDVRERAAVQIRKVIARRKANNTYGHSDETRAKMSETTARAHAKGKIGRPSKLEDVVARELDRLGVRYVRQFAVRDSGGKFMFVIDFWLPDHRVAIEVNGTYWHADPRVYSGTLNTTQAHNLAKYRRKLDALGALDIRVGEAWEIDIKRDPTQAVLEAYTRATGG
jgi:G:T-mismatch repair DNA endonuclease (very short patch repair protein)